MDVAVEVPLPQRLALAHAKPQVRAVAEPFFALDNRLGQFVSQAKETIVTQMRIAWWRDQFRKLPEERPQGDPILDALTHYWQGEEAGLIALVDGWEALLAEPPLPDNAIDEFVAGRAACFSAIARLVDMAGHQEHAARAGRIWAIADLAARMSDADERSFVTSYTPVNDQGGVILPYALRALTILGALGAKSISLGSNSLIDQRRDFLIVMRIGLLGR